MSDLPDSAEYWWSVGGYQVPNERKQRDTVAHNKKMKRNAKIKREFKRRYPEMSHKQISLLAKRNGGYQNIEGKNIEELK